jgi:hypothetical protein
MAVKENFLAAELRTMSGKTARQKKKVYTKSN